MALREAWALGQEMWTSPGFLKQIPWGPQAPELQSLVLTRLHVLNVESERQVEKQSQLLVTNDI